MLQFTLPSCFNLAGCNPVHIEAGLQSRQVRRRKFGIICPYVWNKTEQVQSGIEVSVDDVPAFRTDENSVSKCEVVFLSATMGARFAAWVESVSNGNCCSTHSCLVFYLPAQLTKSHVAYTLCQPTAQHPFDIQVLDADSAIMRYKNGCQLLREVSADGGYVSLLPPETTREFAKIVRPLNALQTLLLGFRMMAFRELAAQSCYLSMMFKNSSWIMDCNSVRECHGFVKAKVDAYGPAPICVRNSYMSPVIFFFGNLNLNRSKELVSVLRNLHAQYFPDETQAFCHLYVTEVRDVQILMLPVDIVRCIFQMLQSFMGIGELDFLSCSNIKRANAISLFVHCGIFSAMGKEVVESSLKVIESMGGGILRYFVCPWEFFATDSIEAVSQLTPGQPTLTHLIASLPFRQAPVIGKAATAYGLTKVSTLLVVRHELYAMSECNHRLFLNVVLYCLLYVLQQLLVFVATTAIKTGGKYGDDFKDILCEFLFKPPDGSPDYKLMEQYMREIEQKIIHRYVNYRSTKD